MIEEKYPELREPTMDELTFEQQTAARARRGRSRTRPRRSYGHACLPRSSRRPRRTADAAPSGARVRGERRGRCARGATLALRAASRAAVADFFGIEGSEIEILPTPPPGVTPTPLPTPVDLPPAAIAVPLDDLDSAAGFDVAFADGTEPGRAYIVTYAGEPSAILQYYGFDLWESQMSSGMVAGKGVPPGVRVEEFELEDGVPARWISGGPHLIVFRTEDDTEIEDSIRTVRRNTLIWRTDHAFYRIETDLSFDDATDIARTLP